MVILSESFVEQSVRIYLKNKGWKLTNLQKKKGEHGIDIKAFHPKWRKNLLIEAKGEGNSSKAQKMHNDFNTILGQILSRMDKEGNAQNRGRIYALAIPKNWEKTFKDKIKKMKYGWSLLKLKVFLVDEKGNVEEKSYLYFVR